LLAGERRSDPARGTVDHTLRVRRRMRIRGHPRAHTCRRARQKVAVGGGVAYGCLVTAMRVAGCSSVGNAVAGERRGFARQAGERVRVASLGVIGRQLPAESRGIVCLRDRVRQVGGGHLASGIEGGEPLCLPLLRRDPRIGPRVREIELRALGDVARRAVGPRRNRPCGHTKGCALCGGAFGSEQRGAGFGDPWQVRAGMLVHAQRAVTNQRAEIGVGVGRGVVRRDGINDALRKRCDVPLQRGNVALSSGNISLQRGYVALCCGNVPL